MSVSEYVRMCSITPVTFVPQKALTHSVLQLPFSFSSVAVVVVVVVVALYVHICEVHFAYARATLLHQQQ